MSDSWLPANKVPEDKNMSKNQGKECKTTIRHTEEENMMYKEEADKLGMSKSEYMRVAIKGYITGSSTNLIESVCTLSTLCNQIMKMNNIDDEQKKYIEGSVRTIWQQLQ